MLRESDREDFTIRRSAMPVAASARACGSSIGRDRPQMTDFADLRPCAAVLMTWLLAIYSFSRRVSPSSRDRGGKPPGCQSDQAVDRQAARDRASIADAIGARRAAIGAARTPIIPSRLQILRSIKARPARPVMVEPRETALRFRPAPSRPIHISSPSDSIQIAFLTSDLYTTSAIQASIPTIHPI